MILSAILLIILIAVFFFSSIHARVQEPLSVAIAGSVTYSAVPKGNQVLNPTLDEGSGSPDFWWTWDSYGGAVFTWIDTGINRSKILKIEKSTDLGSTAWAQTIDHYIGQRANFTFSVYYRSNILTSGFDGGVKIIAEFRNGSTYLGAIDSPHMVESVDDWTLLTVTGQIGNQFKDSDRITLAMGFGCNTGWVEFDEATFTYKA